MAHRLIGIALAGLLASAPVGGVRAESYRWVDDDGVVHYTDDPYQLPEPQRSKVLEKLEKERAAEKERSGARPGHDRSGPTEWHQPLPEGARQERLPAAPGIEDEAAAEEAAATEAEPDAAADGRQGAEQAWRKKAARARERVAELENRCAELERERDLLRRKALIFATPGARQKSIALDDKLEKCRADLREARSYLEQKLPEQAREAGVPRRWVEE